MALINSMAQQHYKCKPVLLRKCWTSHLEPQHSEIGNYHVLSLGKSQERSDSDGGYTKHVANVNSLLLGHVTYSAVEIPCPNENCTCL